MKQEFFLVRIPNKLKCPKCEKLILKRILLVTHGRCNNCGHLFANSITSFMTEKIPVKPQIKVVE